jgi:hypothetical protein
MGALIVRFMLRSGGMLGSSDRQSLAVDVYAFLNEIGGAQAAQRVTTPL